MSFSRVYSAQTSLLNVHTVSVETDISRGLFAFALVGLPDKAVEEARDRVSAAIKNSGYTSPKSKNQKIVISLAPASEKKEGPSFDLAIALSYLLCAEEIEFDPEGKLFLGELSLDGSLRPVRGVLPVVRFAKDAKFKEIYVPRENAEEAALIEGVAVYAADNLKEVIAHLENETRLKPTPRTLLEKHARTSRTDFSDVRGQERAKRGLLIAAAGGHNVAMYGPPGTGKTMLAKAFSGILPELSFDEALEATSIHSIAGALASPSDFVTEPPFRSPHHTSSYVSLVGGGATPKPGEVTLAHRGVLFMDEFPEFERKVIEALRQPLEDRTISVSRAKGTAHFPADVLLVAAMNPCPCGNYGFRGKPCICTPSALSRYRRKMSGPIVDRIDIWLEVDRVEARDLSLSGAQEGEKSDYYRNLVTQARKRQSERFKTNVKLKKNAEMSSRDLVTHVSLDDAAKKTLNMAAERLNFSPRVYHRMIKVARTIADLEEADTITQNHVLEAVEYRPKKFDI